MLVSWHPNATTWQKKLSEMPISRKTGERIHPLSAYSRGWVSVNLTNPHRIIFQIASLCTKRVWSPIVWRGGHRKNANFLGGEMLVFDFDHGPDLDGLKNKFADVTCIVGETQNHMKEKRKGKSDSFHPPEPRHRVICFLDSLCEDLAQFDATNKKWQQRYDADVTKDGGRLYKPCRTVVWINQDEDTELFELEPKPKPVVRNPLTFGNQQLAPHIEKWLEFGLPPKWQNNRNKICYTVARNMAEAGIPINEAIERIFSSDIVIAHDNERFEEVTAAAKSAYSAPN